MPESLEVLNCRCVGAVRRARQRFSRPGGQRGDGCLRGGTGRQDLAGRHLLRRGPRGGGRRPRKSVGDDICCPGSMTKIGGELGQVSHLALLPGGPRRRNSGHDRHKRFVVRHEAETATLQEEAEVADCRKRRQELTVECGIPDLRW